MKQYTRLFAISALGAVLLASCAEMGTESFSRYEDMALEAWIKQHRPELLKNRQQEGGYYVELVEKSTAPSDVKPVRDTACWVAFDFTGRDLAGNIIMTRDASRAYQMGTYTKYTHYVPYFRYFNAAAPHLSDGATLAMVNTLTFDPEYAEAKGVTPEYSLREGDRVRLYLPSRVVGSLGVGSGGYEGQFSLDNNRPYIMEISVLDTLKNPLEREGRDVDGFCESNGGLTKYKREDAPEQSGFRTLPTDPDSPDHPYHDEFPDDWVSANDTIPQVYVNYRFNPADPNCALRFAAPYVSGHEPYVSAGSMSALETDINDALVKRFHPDPDKPYPGVKELKGDSVKLDGTAKIWYIGRFLDGFIFDTNIDEVKRLVFGEVSKAGTVKSYKPEGGSMPTAWYYSVPNLKYGQWAVVATTSTNGYGAIGKAGGTTTTSTGGNTSNLDYLNMMIYYNSLYGNSGYYNPYNNYFGGYGNGYYDPYFNYGYGYGFGFGSDQGSSVETTTSINTEVLPYTPLLYEIYVEPKE